MHLVIFDIDGTLTDSAQIDADCFSAALQEEIGCSVNTDWSLYRHATHPGIARELLFQHVPSSEREVRLIRIQSRSLDLLCSRLSTDPSSCRQIPGANLLLEALNCRPETALALATGGWWPIAVLKLQTAGIATEHLPFASGDDADSREVILRIAYERACYANKRNSFDSVTCCGDGVWDLHAARNLSFRFVGIGKGLQAQRLLAAGATVILPDFTNIEETIQLLCRN